MLVLQAVVSYRSVPRILELFNTETPLKLGWVPHFTSVINWTLRLGLGMLKQVRPVSTPWVAIIDHSIDIGTKKALVVLRVRLDTLSQRGQAIQLKDCECVGLNVSETVNGESISPELERIFCDAGMPNVILKDCDRTLQKGVRLCLEKQKSGIPVIEDIGHVIANALKMQFEKTSDYKQFTALTSKGAKNLRQTRLAFLMPPKLRSKGRFQSIDHLARWGKRLLDMLAVKGAVPKDSLLAKVHASFPKLTDLRPFITHFASTANVVSEVMELLKNKGLNQATYERCCSLSGSLPEDSNVKKCLLSWLEQHIAIQQQITTLPLLVSSDIIESLFGRFKHIIERSPQADMNRTTLLIPALCANPNPEIIAHLFGRTNHDDLKIWENENIPYTLRKKRLAFFSKRNIQNTMH